MDIRLLLIQLSTLFVFSFTFPDFEPPDNPSTTYTYNRFSEIKNQCSSVLPSLSELKPDDNRGTRIKNELSFFNGDWDQEAGGAQLMPYINIDMKRNHLSLRSSSPLKLVSFRVMDVDPVRRSENMVSVSGIMHIGITKDSFSYNPSEWSADFFMRPGHSLLTILFEGVYIESEEDGGERLMCLLGTSKRPSSNEDIHSLKPVNEYSYAHNYNTHGVQDDQILLVLQYPKTFSLTRRGVSGEVKSLNPKLDPNYFDKVHLSSRLSDYSKYHFGSEEFLRACSPYPYPDKLLVDEEVRLFKGQGFCENLENYARTGIANVVPNWESVGTNDYGRLGPFDLGKEIKATSDWRFDNFRLFIQVLKCEPDIEQKKNGTAKVSALFRVRYPWEDKYYISEERSGLSGMTLFAEGMWTSSSGQLCMVGCLGLGATSNTCNSRICLYIPLTVSITQRSLLFGTISSINDEEEVSLRFEMVMQEPGRFTDGYYWTRNLERSYKYSKAIQARAVQTRSKPSLLETKFRKSLLRYPTFHASDVSSLSRLSEELSLRTHALSHSSSNAQAHQTSVQIKILSSGSVFRRFGAQKKTRAMEGEKQVYSSSETTEVSGQITTSGPNNISLFVEGIYDPVVGRMYLIGCKDVRAFQKIMNSSMNLEKGMDCQIEIKIDYPPKNLRWLISPKVAISISSKRNEEDALHFNPISLETLSIDNKEQIDDMTSRKLFEGMLWILMLAVAIFCISLQLRYIKNQEAASAYISLVMLGVQSLSYITPLITGDDFLFKWKVFQSGANQFKKYQEFQELDTIIRCLLLYALMVTQRLSCKVRASRDRLITRTHARKITFPSDKLVLLITLAIHFLGFPVLHVIREMNFARGMSQPGFYSYTSNTTQKLLKWLGELNDHSGLIQDFFLLPQIIGNMLWRIQGKPLRKSYIYGFTTTRVLLHAYGYILDPQYHYHGFHNLVDSHSKSGHIAVAVTMILLALILHIQQRRGHQKVSQTVKLVDEEDRALEYELHKNLLS